MLRDEALNLARVLMDKRGLRDWQVVTTDSEMVNRSTVGYIVCFDSGLLVPVDVTVQVLARCFRPLKLIVLSGPIISSMSILGVREMILHEIAHALTDSGHDEAWRAMAVSIGCSGRETIDPTHYYESGKEATA